MKGSAFMTALKRGESLLTIRVCQLEERLHKAAAPPDAPEWDDYTWGLYVLTLVAQATGSAPRGSEAAAALPRVPPGRYRPLARREPATRKA